MLLMIGPLTYNVYLSYLIQTSVDTFLLTDSIVILVEDVETDRAPP